MHYHRMLKQSKIAVMFMLCISLLTGIIYPLFVTAVAQLLFYDKANGSLIWEKNQLIGSKLIGQYFNEPQYFWPRPSATPFFPYNAQYSSGSNLAMLDPLLLKQIKDRVLLLQSQNVQQSPIPLDLVTTSASGLDPHITIASALYQIPRIARARGITDSVLQNLLLQHIEMREAWILGENRVNVLELNRALDEIRG